MLRCVVIDDEPLARECIIDYVSKTEFLELIGAVSNPTELSKITEKNKVDLIFLDIQMPMMSGIDYLKYTRNRPMVIMTTAYPNYALEGYELDVLDYLVKPITFSRFYKAVTKAKDYYQLQHNLPTTNTEEKAANYFFVKCEQIYEKIYFDDIQYVEALQNYVVIHTLETKHMTLMPMKRIAELLGESKFIRVHKSYIVAIDKVILLEKNQLKLTNQTIPVSRNYRTDVFQRIVDQKLWKK